MKLLNTQGIWSDLSNSSTTGTRYYGRNISVPNTGAATVIINFAIGASNPGVYLYLRTFLMAERQAGSGNIAENYVIYSYATFRSNSSGGFDMTDEAYQYGDGTAILSSGWQTATGTGGYARWQANSTAASYATIYMTVQSNNWSVITVTFP